MTDPAIRNMVISSIRQHLGRDAEKPGAVLYNGWDTLCSNNGLYIMGFNPGGSPDNSKTVIDDLKQLEDDYCSYEAECWYCSTHCRNNEHFGKKPHQKRVKELARILGYDVRQSFAANAIFVRSKKQDDLKASLELFEKCWKIHQIFLSIVQPKIVLCLGNGERSSAFALLKAKFKANEITSGNVKEFIGNIPMADGTVLEGRIIGVRHPSRFNSVKDLEIYQQKTMVQ